MAVPTAQTAAKMVSLLGIGESTGDREVDKLIMEAEDWINEERREVESRTTAAAAAAQAAGPLLKELDRLLMSELDPTSVGLVPM